MYDVMLFSIIDMLGGIHKGECCNNPTCDVSLTPPFFEPAKCDTCGKSCKECKKVNND